MLLEELMLVEAKLVQDYRHEDAFKELPYWPRKEDPKFIAPMDGFHFTFSKGQLILHSTANYNYDGVVALGFIDDMKKSSSGIPRHVQTAIRGEGRDLFNAFGGLVDLGSKIITINKEYDFNSKLRQRALNDMKEIKAAIKNLFKYGVTSDFKLKGVSTPYNGMKVGELLKQEDAVDQLDKLQGAVFYHGTSKKRWEESISKKGLRPGLNGNDVYVDLIKGYSEHNVYLASNAKTAEFYGKRQADKDDDAQYVVIEVRVPDSAKLRPDDHFARSSNGVNLSRDAEKRSIRELGSIAYNGVILPKFLKVLSTKKV